MARDAFVIGVDFGTDSVRSLVVDTSDGKEVASSVYYYPRWRDGLFCDASKSQFRQHPLDYIDGLETTIRDCLRHAGDAVRRNIRGISVDTTGSTPVAVNDEGTPLALTAEFSDNPDAMFVLWKDHTATPEAAEINEHALKYDVNYLQYVGGVYSSEWFWAKLLHVLREDIAVRNACFSWVEHCDWIPFLLTGGKDAREVKRGVCSAGHKALWAKEYGGLPPESFFRDLDPLLSGFAGRIGNVTYTSDTAAGHLSREWAGRLGLTTDTLVGIGAFDCHMGAVGGQIEPYHLSKVMGTSTCDMMVIPPSGIKQKLVRGICGQVDGSILPGMVGLEAGQSAFGDTYAWFRDLLSWPLRHLQITSIPAESASSVRDEMIAAIIPALSLEAAKLPIDHSAELGMDWLNGRRTPDADQTLKGAMTGMTLGSDAPRIFRAWVEATCFGAKAIVERIIGEGIPVRGVIGLGGVARKSPFIMQMMADVLNRSIRIHRSEQTCALGAAMFAATAAGIYRRAEDAMHAMGHGFDMEFHPQPQVIGVYQKRFERYKALGGLVENISREERMSGAPAQVNMDK